jgi:hypothetical protein
MLAVNLVSRSRMRCDGVLQAGQSASIVAVLALIRTDAPERTTGQHTRGPGEGTECVPEPVFTRRRHADFPGLAGSEGWVTSPGLDKYQTPLITAAIEKAARNLPLPVDAISHRDRSNCTSRRPVCGPTRSACHGRCATPE